MCFISRCASAFLSNEFERYHNDARIENYWVNRGPVNMAAFARIYMM